MDVLENAVTEKNVLVEAAAFPTDDRVTYKDSTYEIVSKGQKQQQIFITLIYSFILTRCI